jgi:hypothetical protein
MKAKRRSADGRFARDTQGATAESIAAATVAAGLVLGAAEHLSPTVAAAQQVRLPDMERSTLADHAPPPPAQEAAQAAASAVTSHDAATVEAPAPSAQSSAPASDTAALDTAPHTLGPLPEIGADTGREARSSDAAAASSADAPSLSSPELVHASLSSAADSISSAMKTLIDHVEGLKGEMPGLATLQHQFDGLAENASHLAQEIATAAGATMSGLTHPLDLSELLGGPATPAVPGTADFALGELPPSILGAEVPGAETLGQVASGLAPVSVAYDIVSAAQTAMPVDVPNDPGTVVSEVAPLQLGFLGQSYTDSGDMHDLSHGLVSPLHGFV